MPMFVKFEDGYIVQGPLKEEECPEGFVEYLEVNNVPANGKTTSVTLALINGVCTKTFNGSLSYEKERTAAYPSLGNQLDALWHAMDANVLPRIEPMYSEIKAVKELFPKPLP